MWDYEEKFMIYADHDDLEKLSQYKEEVLIA